MPEMVIAIITMGMEAIWAPWMTVVVEIIASNAKGMF